jgi:biotin synthase
MDKELLKNIRTLYREEPADLFAHGRELARTMRNITASPIRISPECRSEPHCRHCEWWPRVKIDEQFGREIKFENIVKQAITVDQAGIDYVYLASGCYGKIPKKFIRCVSAIKASTNLEVYGLFGAVDPNSLRMFKESGGDGYWCGIEIANEELFKYVRPGDSLEKRYDTMGHVKNLGLKLWSGFIFGIGESMTDRQKAIAKLREYEPDAISILPFIPCMYTQMERSDPPNPFQWAVTLAICRIIMPSADIFTPLTPHNIMTYGLSAGANALSMVFPYSTLPGPFRDITSVKPDYESVFKFLKDESFLTRDWGKIVTGQ